MQLSLVGINHQTAPLAIREKVAISTEKLADSLSLVRSCVPHGVILSTCNRTEIYTTASDGCRAEKVGLDFLKTWASIPYDDLQRYVYVLKNEDAVEHLFRVAGGLESMIVGEFEVLGQVKQALAVAQRKDMVNLPLRQLLQSAIRTGRRVRAETGISKSALSVSSVALDFAAGIVGDLNECKMLVIGTGEAGRLVAKVAGDRGTPRIVIASRTRERASTLATALNAIPIGFDNLADELTNANMVVTCTGAPHWILDFHKIEEIMESRPELPLMIIDIAMPRNVEPEVGRIRNVFLYNIDDLTEVSNLNRKQRESEIRDVEEIIRFEIDKFMSWWQILEVRPTVSALMSQSEKIRLAQLNKTLKKLPPLSDEQRESLEAMTKSIIAKILKDPIIYLNANGNSNQVKMVRELFRLNIERH
ncbi:glutamyl-tRNA reductase [Chloroflexota bacterium]